MVKLGPVVNLFAVVALLGLALTGRISAIELLLLAILYYVAKIANAKKEKV
jgi:hypothetical protein